MPVKEFIVAEISKNWRDGFEVSPSGILAQQFEDVIAVNLERGYLLHCFDLHRVITDPGCMNETIVAVFRRTKSCP